MPETMISLQSVTKTFVADEIETRALDEVNLEIQRGEFVSVRGPSGCGKSTLLGIMGLLDAPSSGRYVLAGQPADKLDSRARAQIRNRDIGFVFQAFNLISDLTVEENVALPLRYRDDLSKRERKARVDEILARVDMHHRLRYYPGQLSGGQQQRVAVARALVGKPGLILADEPTGNLDSRNAELIMAMLEQIHADGATLCMVTHDPQLALLAKRTVSLFDGRVVEDRPNEKHALPSGALASPGA